MLEKSLSPKLVLLAICDRADASGKCSHSSASISDGLFISETTVKSAIKFMQARGVLKIIRRQSEDCNVNLSNLYLLQIPAEFAKDALLASAAGGVGQIPPQGGGIRPGANPAPGLKSTKIKSKSKRARDARACAAASAGAAATSKIEGKARRVRESGLVTWTQTDVTNALKIEDAEPPETLHDAVAEAHRRGKEPLPGTVSLILQERRDAAASAALAARAAARLARIDADSRRRAELDMQELMVLQANPPPQERDL